MINKKILKIFIFILFCSFNNDHLSAKSNVYIVTEIEGKIITNIDVEKEYYYLLGFNKYTRTLKKDELQNLAKKSIIKEKIKENEIIKHFEMSQSTKTVDLILSDLMAKLNIQNQDELKIYTREYYMTINELRKKIEIEHLWNRLIYLKYQNRINLDKKKLENEISKNNQNRNSIEYNLSEILFSPKNKEQFNERIKQINENIKEKGFEQTAILYGESDSAKNGGVLGWINENQLSKNINDELRKININDYTNPISLGNAFVIIKINESRKAKLEFDIKKQLQDMINAEKNRQLNNFSMIHYKKLKNSIFIDEK